MREGRPRREGAQQKIEARHNRQAPAAGEVHPGPGTLPKDRDNAAGKSGPAAPRSPLQAIAADMKRWFLILGVALGALGIVAAFMGLLVPASMLASIVIVAFTLYLFLRLWPEDEARELRPAPPTEKEEAPRRVAMVAAMRVDGPPRSRFMMAVREIARRQGAFRISPQGAERFARTIRHMLRSAKQ